MQDNFNFYKRMADTLKEGARTGGDPIRTGLNVGSNLMKPSKTKSNDKKKEQFHRIQGKMQKRHGTSGSKEFNAGVTHGATAQHAKNKAEKKAKDRKAHDRARVAGERLSGKIVPEKDAAAALKKKLATRECYQHIGMTLAEAMNLVEGDNIQKTIRGGDSFKVPSRKEKNAAAAGISAGTKELIKSRKPYTDAKKDADRVGRREVNRKTGSVSKPEGEMRRKANKRATAKKYQERLAKKGT